MTMFLTYGIVFRKIVIRISENILTKIAPQRFFLPCILFLYSFISFLCIYALSGMCIVIVDLIYRLKHVCDIQYVKKYGLRRFFLIKKWGFARIGIYTKLEPLLWVRSTSYNKLMPKCNIIQIPQLLDQEHLQQLRRERRLQHLQQLGQQQPG